MASMSFDIIFLVIFSNSGINFGIELKLFITISIVVIIIYMSTSLFVSTT